MQHGGCRAEAAHAFPFSRGRVSGPRSTDTAIRLRYAAKERADLERRSGAGRRSHQIPHLRSSRISGARIREAMMEQQKEDEPDAADVHRRCQHDGFGHHHAAHEYGKGRCDLAAVMDCDRAWVQWPSPTDLRRPASLISVLEAWRLTLRMPTASPAISSRSFCTFSPWHRQCGDRHLSGRLPCHLLSLAFIDADCDLSRSHRAAVVDHGRKFRRTPAGPAGSARSQFGALSFQLDCCRLSAGSGSSRRYSKQLGIRTDIACWKAWVQASRLPCGPF